MGLHRITGLLLLCVSAQAQPTSTWKLTRSDHFELYSQNDDAAARAALLWFEELRAFYLQKTGLAPEALHPVHVIGFRSARASISPINCTSPPTRITSEPTPATTSCCRHLTPVNWTRGT